MTAIHLAARHGHINVLNALKDKVSWKVTSTKVNSLQDRAGSGRYDINQAGYTPGIICK